MTVMWAKRASEPAQKFGLLEEKKDGQRIGRKGNVYKTYNAGGRTPGPGRPCVEAVVSHNLAV